MDIKALWQLKLDGILKYDHIRLHKSTRLNYIGNRGTKTKTLRSLNARHHRLRYLQNIFIFLNIHSSLAALTIQIELKFHNPSAVSISVGQSLIFAFRFLSWYVDNSAVVCHVIFMISEININYFSWMNSNKSKPEQKYQHLSDLHFSLNLKLTILTDWSTREEVEFTNELTPIKFSLSHWVIWRPW